MINQKDIGNTNGFGVDGADTINLDVEKFFAIVRKSALWIFIIIGAALFTAYLFIRYTPEEYESRSTLQLDIKSEASVFGFKSFDEDINNISKEIEFLKSNLFLGKVAEEIDMDVSIYAVGEFLNNERYNNSSFTVEYEIKNPSFLDKNFELDILNEKNFRLRYTLPGGALVEEVYAFDETIENESFRFRISLTEHYVEETDHRYYFFRINSLASQIKYLAKNITVQPLDFKANTITVSFTDNNKQKAQDMVVALDTLYLHYTQYEKNKENNQKINFLNEQLKATENKLNELEDYFENFTIDYQTTNLDANLAKTIALLEQLDSQKFDIQKKLEVINNVYNQVVKEENFILSPFERSHLPKDIVAEINDYEKIILEKRKLGNSYKPNTFVIQQAEKELSYISDRILRYINEYKNSLLRLLADIGKQKVKLEQEFTTLPSKKTEYTKTERYYSLYEEFYLTLMKNKAQFELAEAGTTTDYKILSPASIASEPISPNSFLYYGIGLISGLIISVLFVGVRYLAHNKISGQRELEHLTRHPILGAIPYFAKEKTDTDGLLIDKYPKSEISEAFRSLRTNMEFVAAKSEKPVICITSSVSGEGKTFIAANLGGIISLLKNKVVILDLDMRKPRLQKIFYNNISSVGMSTLLIGKTEVKDCILKTGLENLDYIPSGPIPPNPAELISGEHFHRVIEELKQAYDTIIVDTPPVGLVTDGIIAMKKATIPLFVVRSDFSRKIFPKAINKLIQTHHFHNPAFIINSVKRSGNYGCGYGQKAYGYYQEETKTTLFKIKSLLGL